MITNHRAPCPTPDKHRYATQQAADLASRRNRIRSGLHLRTYNCEPGCGWWHLTSLRAPAINHTA